MDIDVKPDVRRQIIRCCFAGDMHAGDARCITAAMAEAKQKLSDPGRVRILINARRIGKMDAEARRLVMADFKRHSLHRLALWGVPGYKRIFLSMFLRAFSANKVGCFETEVAALEWLEE